MMRHNPTGLARHSLIAFLAGGMVISAAAVEPVFTWKAVWVHAGRLTSPAAVKRMAREARAMGFDVVIAEPSEAIVQAVHEHGMQVYAWVDCLKGVAPAEFYKTHPGYLQKVTPAEESLMTRPRENPDRDNVQPGPWLCPDFGLLEVERQALEILVKRYAVDGVALDNVGYRNYYACFCQYSETRRAEYAKRHPALTRSQVMRDFSEQALGAYVQQVGDVVRRIHPALKLAIRIHPDFDLNPRYGNRLEVDYCGETISGSTRPFWSYTKIYARTQRFLEAEGDYQGENQFVPWIGLMSGPLKKSPERLRTEIRIAACAGTGLLMISGYETLAENPGLAAVVARELK